MRTPSALTFSVLFSFLFLASTPALADPPPWAPAHGYYKKKGPKHAAPPPAVQYEIPPGVAQGRCNREAIGAVIGGTLGGIAGSQVGKGDGKTAATIAGTIIGYLIGKSIGQAMDDSDHRCAAQALDYVEDRKSLKWNNPDLGTEYMVTPTRTFWQNGQYCREYNTSLFTDGMAQQETERACRQEDGNWYTITN